MKPIWQLDASDVIGLQGDSPRFIRFVNALVAAQARAGGVADAEVRLNVKDTEGDGGVDAAVGQAVPAPRDPSGYLSVPTCWQYKAQPVGNIKTKNGGGQEAALREEVSKSHSSALIAKGYGYRFCIADEMPDEKKTKWEGWLNEEVEKIKPGAPPARVLTASDLATWANRYPAIVGGYFRHELAQLIPLDAWHETLRALTPEYVPGTSWGATADAIRRHVDFGERVTTVLMVQGEAGVGKSRGTCEALLGDAARKALVAVTSDEKVALELARHVARTPHTQAILIADECSLEYRERLGQLVPACADRFRVIAIDNNMQREGGVGEIRFAHLRPDVVEQVLERNFPAVVVDHRRAYASLSGGFVRLAVDLCQSDHLFPPEGIRETGFGFFHDRYLRNRLSPAELNALAVVSLLPRVGYRDDVKAELEQLCSLPLVGISAADVVKTANRLKQSPGFIALAGRYLYATPTLIAHIAFQAAWNQWVAPDPSAFLAALPEGLIEPFTERVQAAGTGAMRETVSDFFLGWAGKLGPPDLGSEEAVARLVRLVEVQAGLFLPLLRGLLEGTSLDELRRLHSAGLGGQRARRQLVWLAEKLAYFPETFPDAEAVLLRLALAETEPHLGNSASRLWAAMFRAALSGTPIPFHERLLLLERRLQGADGTRLPLSLSAFDEALEYGPVSRLASPPVVSGRIPPPQWRPADMAERQACQRATLALASRIAAGGGAVGDGVRAAVVRRLSPLLLAGYLDEVRAVIGPPPLPDSLLAQLVRELEQFLDVFCREHSIPVHRPRGTTGGESGERPETLSRAASTELEIRVREWYRSLTAGDLHGRVVGLVGQEFWHQQLHGDPDEWQRSLDALAGELLRSPSDLDRELGWLSSPEARSAFRFGQALAGADADGTLLDRMLGDVPRSGGTVLARGYVERIVTARPDLLPQVNVRLDRLQAEAPLVAYDIIWSAGEEIRKVNRLFEMVDGGGLAAEYLRALEYGVRGRSLTEEELLGAIDRLVRAAEADNDRAAPAAVRLLYGWLHPDRRTAAAERLRENDRVREVLPRVLELAFAEAGREANFWMRLAEDWAVVDPAAAVRLLATALRSPDYNTRALAENSLADLARSHPDSVMAAVGETVLNPTSGWLFRVDDFSHLLGSLPTSVVRDWIERVGQEGARGLARHLPPPGLSDAGEPIVHPLTEFVLSSFEDDDEVFREFFAGTHAGQVYSGDIAAEHEKEAAVARRFLSHPLRRVREWALAEIQSASRQAERWRQRDEEAAVS